MKMKKFVKSSLLTVASIGLSFSLLQGVSAAEKMMMKGYAKWSSSPAAYKLSTKMARLAMKPWTKDDTIENGPGPLKDWTTSRNFPAPSKQSFRSWYKEREKSGEAK